MSLILMTDSLYTEVKGSGHDIVLLHGWGMHGGLWGEFNTLLSSDCCTHSMDLPGFGFSHNVENDFTLDALTEVVEDYIKQLGRPVSLLGWSLGGLITLNILKRKNIVLNKVILIATTPSFTKKLGWQCAMEQSVFNDFSNDLKTDYKKALKRFLSLQTRGSDIAREELRELNNKLNERGEPNIKALEKGLKILSEADLRTEIKNNIATMIILGEKDTLVPVSVKNEFEKMFHNLNKLFLYKTGHAPFISNPEIFEEKIKNFINE
jgi:pimeloyl-[acyl-carrier protein] methyl ester esterase